MLTENLVISSESLGCDLQYRVYLPTGTDSNNEELARQFKQILEEKGCELFYREVPFGHNWNNWRPLLDDALAYYFRPDEIVAVGPDTEKN